MIDDRKRKYHYRIIFYGKDGSMLTRMDINRSDLLIVEGDINVYSINLQHIPMVLLDHTHSIDIGIVE